VHTKEFATMALSKSALSELLDALRAGGDLDVVREALALVLQALIEAEAAQQIGADRYERSASRTTHRNGTRARRLSTKAGDVELRIPKLAMCASDGEGLHPGLGALLESFIGRLAVQAAVGTVVVVEVLPLLELVVEDLGVVDHHPVQEAVELLGIDAVGALDLAVEPGRSGLDVDMAGAFV